MQDVAKAIASTAMWKIIFLCQCSTYTTNCITNVVALKELHPLNHKTLISTNFTYKQLLFI
jgi:hypothetical protein